LHILLAHNDYGRFSGEESAVENVSAVLTENGHHVSWFRKSSVPYDGPMIDKVKALFSGIYSVRSRHEIAAELNGKSIDVAQVQNLYPYISSSILPELRRHGVPIVMRCPNYRLFCPSGLHLRNGEVCEECLGPSREWRCVVNNCEGDLFRSVGYAARNAFARMTRVILNNVSIFVVLTEFQRERFIAAGIPRERIEILPNTARFDADEPPAYSGSTVSFVGRVSPEKGVLEFLEAARQLPEVPFRIAGSSNRMPGIEAQSPSNVEYCGFLEGDDLDDFYAESRILVFPSKWFEGFPNTISKAMVHAKPTIAARLGAAAEIVVDGETGLLVEPGSGDDLADKIRYLWERPDECAVLGLNGWHKARREYSDERFYHQLMAIYAKARVIAPTLG
jgi:glycosyltransferase involved in cell wall biosynthesis